MPHTLLSSLAEALAQFSDRIKQHKLHLIKSCLLSPNLTIHFLFSPQKKKMSTIPLQTTPTADMPEVLVDFTSAYLVSWQILCHSLAKKSFFSLYGAVAAQPAQQAICKVRTEVMEVKRSMLDRRNADFILWPPCVEVQRCSGCCNNRLMKCVPIVTSSRNLQVKTKACWQVAPN